MVSQSNRPAARGVVPAAIRPEETIAIHPTRFDQLFTAATPLIAAGQHGVDTPPVENGERWPVSTVFRPDPAGPLTRRLDQLTLEAAQIAGLILTRGTVMACAHPLDDHANRLQKLYADALGPDGWLEAEEIRDIWYVNLLHFAAPIPDPTTLIAWVTAHRHVPLGKVTVNTAELVRFRHTLGPRPYMRPETLVAVPLSAQ
ncbi:hypothetical protein BWI15_36570 [Kribbella sp. ALI-6-A]|uniref:hypothetical protein n=1 Tax=Kribbella sp. ALI-6-A TaxID=1933817 RepID=UPI00097BD427|nr:hypothetical protein [Kribbella sp. ALI-6-A]ONI68510.1 hypothetical protein BWI15_36570 [Kribbella sp. ALI-6-A]